ncbi:gephyrin-like molybdotransferase Glp [Lysinibacter sp. HNR]|uniref:molybdopterin molybdotransferase MoeA n=1 Tax=Lysinibacter sp. HNR TaxID=3031408 RepID=UPI002434FD2F|nr:gephyrin-like molybdotransferase Glp [Lysinibacter sp. HNR]WGD36566.1 molybdopterin molybdotransferase MoeA [Lysinibacter sp. HNR]
MISVEEHLAAVLTRIAVLPPSTVPIDRAHRLTLAENVRSQHDIPLWDNSAMDGYAVRQADVAGTSAEQPVSLEVVADIPAGSSLTPTLEKGQAARIMTGAPVPASADAVVPLEHTEITPHDPGTRTQTPGTHTQTPHTQSPGTRILVTTEPRPGAHIRRAGEDTRRDETVASRGEVLTAERVAAIASAGVGSVSVHPRPRVTVIATGSELVAPGKPLAHGQIPDSNSLLIAALVTACGAETVATLRVPDDERALRLVLDESAAISDAVVLTGGVSVGAYDVVKAVLAPTGSVDFVRVSMQPGKPQGFGTLPGGIPVFGLPGNPVSAWVSFEVFVRPALLAMQGREGTDRAPRDAVAEMGWKTPEGRTQYIPVIATTPARGPWTVRPAAAGGSGSHLVGGLGRANGYAVVPAEVSRVREGDTVSVILVES